MRSETSWEVQTRQLEAILGTARPTVLLKLASSDVLGILEGWLWAGDADRQMTFLRLLLQTAARLPFPPIMLQHSHFLKAVGVLQRYRSRPGGPPAGGGGGGGAGPGGGVWWGPAPGGRGGG